MKTKIYLFMAIFLTLTAFKIEAQQKVGFSGKIFFRDGTFVNFNYLGNLEGIKEYYLGGKLGSQNVNFRYDELKEIHFTNKNGSYRSNSNTDGCDAMIINKSGERFTLSNCVTEYNGDIFYTYNDPVTKALKDSGATIINNISHIVIGADSGEVKQNSRTNEFFPALYIFDPFTGERLAWARRR